MQNVRNSRNAYIFEEHNNDMMMMMMMATATTALVDFFFLTLSLPYLSDLCDKIRFWMCFIGELLRLKKLKHKVDQCTKKNLAASKEGPQKIYRDPGFPLFEARDLGFKAKTKAKSW